MEIFKELFFLNNDFKNHKLTVICIYLFIKFEFYRESNFGGRELAFKSKTNLGNFNFSCKFLKKNYFKYLLGQFFRVKLLNIRRSKIVFARHETGA